MCADTLDKLLQRVSNGHKPCIDSRAAKPGDLFFALCGDNTNGNLFAGNALENGCSLAIVDDKSVVKSEKFLLVEDVLTTLQNLSKAYRDTLNIPVIGITGSNGKTTTKELMHAVFAKKHEVFATRGNLNNHIGVPISLLSIEKDHEIAIIEMGANHNQEIAHLCQLAKPAYGLITNIGKAHLEGFGTIEDVTQAKCELFDYLNKNKGVLFINQNDPRLKNYKHATAAVRYGSGKDIHCHGRILETAPQLKTKFSVDKDFGMAKKGAEGVATTSLAGAYNFENILAALVTGLYFGISPEQASAAIQSYTPQNHRSQIIRTNQNLVVMDAYNANPTSMAAALESFTVMEGRPKAVMLGDMLELGQEARTEHQEVLSQLQSLPVDLIILVGEHFMEVAESAAQVKVFPDVQKAGEYLAGNTLKGYQILVKGSRGIEMEKLLQYL